MKEEQWCFDRYLYFSICIHKVFSKIFIGFFTSKGNSFSQIAVHTFGGCDIFFYFMNYLTKLKLLP